MFWRATGRASRLNCHKSESDWKRPSCESRTKRQIDTCVLRRAGGSKAQVLSVVAPDDNKVFGITFRTPPRDSTGLPHILEHSVLCGSRLYPTKEPFVELLKGSLQTFLNAFTYPDRTCYPVASQNLEDFRNLVSRLRPTTFSYALSVVRV